MGKPKNSTTMTGASHKSGGKAVCATIVIKAGMIWLISFVGIYSLMTLVHLCILLCNPSAPQALQHVPEPEPHLFGKFVMWADTSTVHQPNRIERFFDWGDDSTKKLAYFSSEGMELEGCGDAYDRDTAHPDALALFVTQYSDEGKTKALSGGKFCSAVKLTPSWVATAAHCLVEDQGLPNATFQYHWPTSDLTAVALDETDSSASIVEHRIDAAFVTADFVRTGELETDIAFLHLAEPSDELTATIPIWEAPPCVPKEEDIGHATIFRGALSTSCEVTTDGRFIYGYETCAVKPGWSGSPVIVDGQLAGITVARRTSNNQCRCDPEMNAAILDRDDLKWLDNFGETLLASATRRQREGRL